MSASPRPLPITPFATPSLASPTKTSTLDNDMARYAFKSYRPRSAIATNDYFSNTLLHDAPTIYTWSPPMSAKHTGGDEDGEENGEEKCTEKTAERPWQ